MSASSTAVSDRDASADPSNWVALLLSAVAKLQSIEVSTGTPSFSVILFDGLKSIQWESDWSKPIEKDSRLVVHLVAMSLLKLDQRAIPLLECRALIINEPIPNSTSVVFASVTKP